MNELETKMIELLKEGKKRFGYVGVKAEFEAEGTRFAELLKLSGIVKKADLNLGLKIGGAEAVRDLLEGRQIGIDYIIAPMVETPYALSKYIAAKNKVYSLYEQKKVKFLFNLETIASFNNLEGLMSVASAKNGVDGIVFGRVDFVGSKNLDRNSIDSDKITNYCLKVAKECKSNNLEFVVGGGVARESISAITKIKSEYLNRFETRKVIFNSTAIDNSNVEQGLTNAVHFELLWLTNKRNYYYNISKEDSTRIDMLEKRWKILQNN